MKKIDKVVYFVRHGQSEHNVSPVFQSPESPLSEAGQKQAENIANRITKIEFETLLSSPFQRAKETAEIIAKITGKNPEFSDLFIERVKPSKINGKSYDDQEASRIWHEWEKSLFTTDLKIEDGENFNDLIKRADKALKFLEERPEKSLVVVTHGFFLRTIIARVLLGESLSEDNYKNFQFSATMENTGLSAIRYSKGYEDTRWRLWIYNDHAHLG
jgi:broad specificity phosphatase PhoE